MPDSRVLDVLCHGKATPGRALMLGLVNRLQCPTTPNCCRNGAEARAILKKHTRTAAHAFLLSTLLFGLRGFAQTTATPAPGSTVVIPPSGPAAPDAATLPGTPNSVRLKPGMTALIKAPGGTISTPGAPGQTTTTNTSPSGTNTSNPQPPNGVEVEVGVASRIGGPGISNYSSTNGTLSLTNLGRATPQLLTGVGFSCDTSTKTTTSVAPSGAALLSLQKTGDNNTFCNSWAGHFGAFVSVQIGAGSSQTISGYSVGLTYPVGKYLRLLAGFSMTPTDEISPGFANAAAQYVTKNPTLFPGVNPANLASNSYGAFDGIQTTTTAPMVAAVPSATIYYPGSATETRYRGGFIIGVALPINIYNLLGGNNKSQ